MLILSLHPGSHVTFFRVKPETLASMGMTLHSHQDSSCRYEDKKFLLHIQFTHVIGVRHFETYLCWSIDHV